MWKFLLVLIACLVFIGCAGFLRTIGDIKEDPQGFVEDSDAIGITVDGLFSGLPLWVVFLSGIGTHFLRTWYKNTRKDLARLKTNG